MVHSYFFSRMEGDESKLHEIIPISFHIHSILTYKCITISSNKEPGIQTRSVTKVAWVQMPKMHGVNKAVKPNFKPVEQVQREGMPKAISKPPVKSHSAPQCSQ